MREQGARHERKRRQNLFLAPLQKTEVRGRKRHFFEFFFFFFFFFFEFFLPQPLFSIPAPVPLTDASKRRKTHR